MKKSELKKLIAEALEEKTHLLSAKDVVDLVQDTPVEIEDGNKVREYDNAEQFLRFFVKHSPEKVYRYGRHEGRFVAVDKPEPVTPRRSTPSVPLTKAQQDVSVQRFYDTLNYKGD